MATIRRISLLFSIGTLLFLYKTVYRISRCRTTPFTAMLLLALQIQFLYAGRFGRQEIVLLFFHLLSLFLFYKGRETGKLRYDLFAGLCIAVCMGVHPNSFIIFLPLFFLYMFKIFTTEETKVRNVLVFLIPVFIGAAVFIGISYSFDPSFLQHYLSYGSTLGVADSLPDKIRGLYPYFYKLFFRISGTYYTPWIQVELILLGAAALSGLVFFIMFVSRRGRGIKKPDSGVSEMVILVFSILLGIVLIGRYNQTSVIFLFPSGIILLSFLIRRFCRETKLKRVLAAPLICFFAVSSFFQIYPWVREDHYRQYLSRISLYAPSEAVVLANLNMEPYFDTGNLYDYRNLSYLEQTGTSFKQYIRDRNIEYIFIPEEMDVIYNSRPVWNIIYGNIWPYYEEMQRFLQLECEYLGRFDAPVYAMRIVRYQKEKQWGVNVFSCVRKDGATSKPTSEIKKGQ